MINRYNVSFVILVICGFLFAKLYSSEGWLCIVGILGLAFTFVSLQFLGERKAYSYTNKIIQDIKEKL